MDVEWAVATRVQADRDVVIISGARAKPLDPSIPPAGPYSRVPTTAKMGIDATIPDNVPRERFHRIEYAYADDVMLSDFLGPAAECVTPTQDIAIDELAKKIEILITQEPLYFSELCETFIDFGFQSVTRAVGYLHQKGTLWQDPEGRFCLKESTFAAKAPER